MKKDYWLAFRGSGIDNKSGGHLSAQGCFVPRRAAPWYDRLRNPPPVGQMNFHAHACAWSSSAVKPRSPSADITGGFDELSPPFVWQIEHIGFSEEELKVAVNWAR